MRIVKKWQRLTLLFDFKRCWDCLKFQQLNVELETYFQITETASQSDKADQRFTGLKLGVLNKKVDELCRYLEVRS